MGAAAAFAVSSHVPCPSFESIHFLLSCVSWLLKTKSRANSYIALRDLDEGEKRIIRSLGILAFTMHDIDKLGINRCACSMPLARALMTGRSRVIEEAMVHADPYGVRPLHVSFDIDACDPSFAPATGVSCPSFTVFL
jgi:arginase family enzyme